MSCVYVCRVSLAVSDSLQPCRLWPARLLCWGGVFSRQECWSVWANTGCHTLLEHYISCCPSHQLPSTWCCQGTSSCTTSTPGPPRGKPKSSRAASGANPSGWPTCRGGNKTTGAVWLRKKIQNLPTSYTSCRLNPHDQQGRLCVYGIYKRSLRAPTKENTQVLIAVDIVGKNTQEYNQIRIWAAPTAGPEISTMLEGMLGRWGGLWLPVRERTLTAVTQEKHWLFLSFDLFCRFFWIFLFFLFPPLL